MQLAERQNFRAARSDDLAIHDCIGRKRGQRRVQLGKSGRDFIERARVNSHASVFNVGLRANPVEFVFDQEFARHGARDVSEIAGRRRQHELERMK